MAHFQLASSPRDCGGKVKYPNSWKALAKNETIGQKAQRLQLGIFRFLRIVKWLHFGPNKKARAFEEAIKDRTLLSAYLITVDTTRIRWMK